MGQLQWLWGGGMEAKRQTHKNGNDVRADFDHDGAIVRPKIAQNFSSSKKVGNKDNWCRVPSVLARHLPSHWRATSGNQFVFLSLPVASGRVLMFDPFLISPDLLCPVFRRFGPWTWYEVPNSWEQ